MNFADFEKGANRKLQGHSSEIDAEGLWNDLEPILEENRKKRTYGFWLFYFGFLFCFIAGAPFLFNSWESKPPPTAFSHSPSYHFVAQQASLDACQTMPTIKNKKDIKLPNTTKKYAESSQSARSPIPVFQSTPLSDKKNAEALAKPSNAIQNEVIIEDGSAFTAWNTPVFSILPIEKMVYSNKIETIPITPGLVQSKRKRKKKTAWQWGLGVNAGLGLFSNKLNSQNTDYLTSRSMTEKTLESWQMGGAIYLRHKSNFFLQSGLEISRFSSRFSISRFELEDNTITNTLKSIYISESYSDTTRIYGSVSEITSKGYLKTTYNHSYLVNLPLLIGYSFGKKHWSFSIAGGALINFHQNKNGEILNPDGSYYNLKKDTNNWYKRNLGFGAYTTVSLDYTPKKQWQISLQPNYRFPITQSTAANPVQEKFQTFGVKLGLKYWLESGNLKSNSRTTSKSKNLRK